MKKTFTEKVHAVVQKIPKGKTMTYQQVAAKAGSPRASRAVGNIMKRNRNLKTPCHRVIRSDGGLGGYAFGGTTKKRTILKREGAI